MPKGKRRAKAAATRTKAVANPKPVREVDGVFVDRERLDHAASALAAAGFGYADMTAVLKRHLDGGRRVAITDLPAAGFTEADKRQVRTLATSMSGAVGALAALGVTVATGGSAAAAVMAAALVGGSAASGVHVFKTLQGFDGEGEDVILTVRVKNTRDEERVAEIFQRHGAVQSWAQDRPY
jgi:hypothetical protein